MFDNRYTGMPDNMFKTNNYKGLGCNIMLFPIMKSSTKLDEQFVIFI